MITNCNFKLTPKEQEEIKKLSEKSQRLLQENLNKQRDTLFQVSLLEDGKMEYILNAQEHYKLRALASFLESYVENLKENYLQIYEEDEEEVEE